MFLPEKHLHLPKLKVELTFDDQKMQFYPSHTMLQEVLTSVVEKIAASLKSVRIPDFLKFDQHRSQWSSPSPFILDIDSQRFHQWHQRILGHNN
jgi:hypothetical protein